MNFIVPLITLSTLLVLALILKAVSLLAAKLFTKTLSPAAKRIWVCIHVIFVVLLLGGMIAETVIHWLSSSVPAENFPAYLQLMDGINSKMVITGMMGSALTGFWLCFRTNWGVFRHLWIVLKWLGCAISMIWGIMVIGQSMGSRFEPVLDSGIFTSVNPLFASWSSHLYVGQFVGIATLGVLFVISYLKPKKQLIKLP